MNVAAHDIDGLAELGGAGLPDVEGFGGRARSGISCSRECGFRGADEAGEFARRAIVVEDGFITDYNQLNEFPFPPGYDVIDLRLGATDTSVCDENSEDQFEASDFACTTHVLQSAAIGAVNADSGETLGSDESYVNGD